MTSILKDKLKFQQVHPEFFQNRDDSGFKSFLLVVVVLVVVVVFCNFFFTILKAATPE